MNPTGPLPPSNRYDPVQPAGGQSYAGGRSAGGYPPTPRTPSPPRSELLSVFQKYKKKVGDWITANFLFLRVNTKYALLQHKLTFCIDRFMHVYDLGLIRTLKKSLFLAII